MEKFLEILRQYEESLGMKQKTISNPVDEYLNMPLEQMRKLSQQDCREIALCLSQYALFVQRCYNEQMNIHQNAKNKLDRMIVQEMQQIRAITTDERRILAIKGNEAAHKMDQIKNEAWFKANQIGNLSAQIDKIGKQFENLGWNRKAQ